MPMNLLMVYLNYCFSFKVLISNFCYLTSCSMFIKKKNMLIIQAMTN